MIERLVDVTYPRPDVAVVVLEGGQDLVTADETEEFVAGLIAAHDLVIVDLSGTDFADSAFIGVLLRVNRLAAKRGTVVRLQLGPNPIVRRALEITGVLGLLNVTDTREEALAG
jgi:anti-anti-sigma factor